MYRFKTLDFYVFGEVLSPLCMGLLVLTFALVVGRLLKLIEMMVNHGVTPMEIMQLLGYIVPGFLELTLPMAVLLGALLGFGRMSADHELIAARACGISLYRLAAAGDGTGFPHLWAGELDGLRGAPLGQLQSARPALSSGAFTRDRRS